MRVVHGDKELMENITVGGPRMTDGSAEVGITPTVVVDRTPPTPGTVVRQLRGYLDLP